MKARRQLCVLRPALLAAAGISRAVRRFFFVLSRVHMRCFEREARGRLELGVGCQVLLEQELAIVGIGADTA